MGSTGAASTPPPAAALVEQRDDDAAPVESALAHLLNHSTARASWPAALRTVGTSSAPTCRLTARSLLSRYSTSISTVGTTTVENAVDEPST
jgi:hypothetical protein